ncbi:bifunctional 2-polyprenyl-6-hydroxyphenol methylase/3-demethylubiquinol 3-O-methyltransferase UbiG [Candidatus Pelagibacter communis]|uniref:bifunctional 2-polyprenyl-6-hydroxyphenol methylase/3-demethylubiquinol 3-O-methyltransferase UbiG n=1 Tax=Pelagibacter ubique TaxID=198252 RepID=UPI00094C1558|nr:bifunctional 2-polyprenyl-6-hydroxyphenol methylase/3-demethylubiquinol 3-O-methyltransferase UbiG [Candidatus Pelagibacter ubique]
MKKDTINKKEIDKFSKLADEWWDPEGKFKPLHNFNPVRLRYIKNTITKKFGNKSEKLPLKDIKILDIGCGGGLLSEPLSRLGATVTGIDASDRNIKIAKMHLKKSKLHVDYYCSSPDKFVAKEKFDVVLNMEIVEHVDNVDFFLLKSSELLRKNGLMFIATLNKTLKSYVFAIIGAEYILKWLPIGTHDWNKFLTPGDLTNICKNNSLNLNELIGVKFDILKNEWIVSEDSSVNYLAQFSKT